MPLPMTKTALSPGFVNHHLQYISIWFNSYNMNFFWYNPILSLNWCDNGNGHGAEQRGALAPSAGGKPLADGVFVGLRIQPAERGWFRSVVAPGFFQCILSINIITSHILKIVILNHDPLDLIQRNLIARPVIELSRLRAFVVGDLLGMLDGAAVLQVGGDAGGPKRMAANGFR
jgi:hypothetical protein